MSFTLFIYILFINHGIFSIDLLNYKELSSTKYGHLGGDITTYKDQLIAIGGGRKYDLYSQYYIYMSNEHFHNESGGNRKVEVFQNRVVQNTGIFIDIPKILFGHKKAYERCAKIDIYCLVLVSITSFDFVLRFRASISSFDFEFQFQVSISSFSISSLSFDF